MPILVVCPRCGAKLNAPDSGAGKHVRCPKEGCGTIVPIPGLLPAEEVVEAVAVAAPPPRVVRVAAEIEEDDVEVIEDEPAKPRPRRKPRYADDDDYDFDHPRRTRRKTRIHPAIIVGVLVGSVLTLVGGGYAIYRVLSEKSTSSTASTSGGPNEPRHSGLAGWQEFSYPDAGFRASFPQAPQLVPGSQPPIPLRGYESGTGSKINNWGSGDRKAIYVVSLRFRGGFSPPDFMSAIATLRQSATNKGDTRVSEPRTVNWGGEQAVEVTLDELTARTGGRGGRMILRYTTLGSRAFIATIGGSPATSIRPEEVQGFFDSFAFNQ